MTKENNGKKDGNGKRQREKIIEQIHPDIQRSIWVIALVAIAVILLLAAAGKAGPVGILLFKLLHKLFGVGYYLLPLVSLFYVFALVAPGERRLFGITAIGGIVFIISSLGFLDIVAPAKGGLAGVLVGTLEKPFGKIAALVITGGFVAASFLVTLNRPLQLGKLWAALQPKSKEPRKNPPARGEEEMNVILPPEPPRQEERKEENPSARAEEGREPVVREQKKAEFGDVKQVQIENYVLPPISLLSTSTEKPTIGDLRANANIIKRTFESFGILVEMGEISVGPSVTRYTLKPAEGIKLARVTALHQDLALALAAHPIRIEAPIPGKALVGIEVPNKAAAIVRLGSLLLYPDFQKAGPLTFVVGRDVNGDPIFADIAKMPHLLIAGATGSGKSIIIHDLIISLLYKNSPRTLRFIMADPKRVELTTYNDIPHLLAPVITDNKKAIGALRWATQEMERRYQVLQEGGSRDIKSHNSKRDEELLPYILIVIDELADLMATYGREVEGTIIRLAQMARATGIHLILSTQRPSVEVITGLIKANIPSRIALQVASQIDSRTILDSAGAEKLLGRGDLLFVSPDFSKPKRIQGSFIEEREIKKVADFIRKNNKEAVQEEKEEAKEQVEEFEELGERAGENGKRVNFEEYAVGDDSDELYEDAVEVVRAAGKASTSLLQRRLKVGYARAARLMDMMEERGVVGPGEGAKPREVLL
ncbi:MAG: DNA translocase FtsK [Patescibacteria group bacterium]